MNVPTAPFASPLEAAYWGPPAVTPQRIEAWRRWVDDYTHETAVNWVAGGYSEAAAVAAIEDVLDDWAELDDVEWMPTGLALMAANVHPTITEALGKTKPLEGELRAEFMNATRTAVTSTLPERIECVAYQLGITVQQAEKLAAGVVTDYEPDEIGERTALYRYFDDGGFLLYVGITNSTDARDNQHRRASRWHRMQSHKTAEWFDSREAAHAAERTAIQVERPLFNTAHVDEASKARAIDYLFDRVEASA